MTIRIIPRLDIKGPNLVKGIHLEGLRVLGKPQHFARHYYEQGADELFFMDAVASLYDRNSLTDIIELTASEIFIPLCVGGGLRTVDDIRTVLQAGADKVAINTAAITRHEFVSEAARMFGSSTIVVSLEAIRQPDGRYLCFTGNGRNATGVEAVEWAMRATGLGAGEISITSVDREGTGRGFDLELIERIGERVSVPVIAHGGAGTAEHVLAAIVEGGANAVGVASMFHYHPGCLSGWPGEDFDGEGNIQFLRQGLTTTMVDPTTIADLKSFLRQGGVDVRIPG